MDSVAAWQLSGSTRCRLERLNGVCICGLFSDTLLEINISHLGKRKIIFKYGLSGGYVNSLEGIFCLYTWWRFVKTQTDLKFWKIWKGFFHLFCFLGEGNLGIFCTCMYYTFVSKTKWQMQISIPNI